ncbi:MAG TPA: hypothetical protein PKD05_12270 [Candidatus Melainabacteria bacterium]|nr:hypothetical protein [Candidatus Melainabacteria bacterium]
MKDEKDWKEDVLRHLRGVFEELDINHDGVLRKKRCRITIDRRAARVPTSRLR